MSEKESESTMYTVQYTDDGEHRKHHCECLKSALEYATNLNVHVTISGYDLEIVGIFGVDSINDGNLPNGQIYNWKKRR